jgi:curved DNA-binding protein CbpA
MDIQRSFEILELHRSASLEEAKQAYKDIVNVWHPDRFSNNPRLRQKAEGKLKEVNVAYETVRSFLSRNQEVEPRQKVTVQAQAKPQARDDTEVAVEAGTRIILNLCSYLYKTLRSIVVAQASKANPEANVKPDAPQQARRQSRGDGGGTGRGRVTGKGKGMGRGRQRGKGGGRMGRGKGSFS